MFPAARSRRRSPYSRRAVIEILESRNLLSGAGLPAIAAAPLLHVAAQVSPSVVNATPAGYTPSQVRAAYGFTGVTFTGPGGSTIAADGKGQTIAIVAAYGDPTIASDLNTFDSTFGIPSPPSFRVVNQKGGSQLPPADAGWALETALDVQWAHAMAPQANLLLVQANSASLTDLMTAVDYARRQPGVSVVSMSWGANEFYGETQYDTYFTTPAGHAGVTFVAAAGDSGAPATWPAVSPNVVAVGGTSLNLADPQGTYGSEAGWSYGGGGYSSRERAPAYQSKVQATASRATPDVAFDADPYTGVPVYSSLAYAGYSGWFQVGGTSAGAPQWAALLAIADQGRVLNGQGTLAGPARLYALPAGDFHDVRGGNNGYAAGPGYDLVTGLGTPQANLIVQHLVGTAPGAAKSVGAGGQSVAAAWRRRFALAAGAELPKTASADVQAVIASIYGSARPEHAPAPQRQAVVLDWEFLS